MAVPLDELRARLRRHPPDRYPVQHATAQFHLGLALTELGRLSEAEDALGAAAELFDPACLPAEHAKALNALGALLRLAGRGDRAAAAFTRAAALFEQARLPLEQGAALFNLGLVEAARGAGEAPLRAARRLLDPAVVPAQAAAAARELGAVLLAAAALDEAEATLEEAMALAKRAGDRAGLGSTANLLGLTRLAGGRPVDAVDAFRAAAGAHPRSVRPEGHAMAKANLALAHERAGHRAHALLAAAQASATPGAPRPVLAQVDDICHRLGRRPGVLLEVLDREPSERWASIMREELARWAVADPEERRGEVSAWVARVAAVPEGADLARTWLGALLELDPGSMATLVRATLECVRAGDAGQRERVRSQLSRAMVRFHPPQWMRLQHAFTTVAGELGLEGEWG